MLFVMASNNFICAGFLGVVYGMVCRSVSVWLSAFAGFYKVKGDSFVEIRQAYGGEKVFSRARVPP